MTVFICHKRFSFYLDLNLKRLAGYRISYHIVLKMCKDNGAHKKIFVGCHRTMFIICSKFTSWFKLCLLWERENALQFISCYDNSTTVKIEFPLGSQKNGNNFVMMCNLYYGTICYHHTETKQIKYQLWWLTWVLLVQFEAKGLIQKNCLIWI